MDVASSMQDPYDDNAGTDDAIERDIRYDGEGADIVAELGPSAANSRVGCDDALERAGDPPDHLIGNPQAGSRLIIESHACEVRAGDWTVRNAHYGLVFCRALRSVALSFRTSSKIRSDGIVPARSIDA